MTAISTGSATMAMRAMAVRLARRFAPREAARLSEWRVAIRSVQSRYRAWHGGRFPSLLAPRRYTEKVQWRKLFDLNPDFAVLSDKAAARDFVAAQVGAETLALPEPALLARMIDIAERIGAGFDQVRVDVYDLGDRALMGEVTIYPWSGSVPFAPDEADEAFGRFWSIKLPRLRAAWTVLVRRREIRHPAMAAARP